MSIYPRLLGFFCAIAVAPAQETIHHSSVSGRIIDPSGALVEAARVTARHLDTNVAQTVESDIEGRFRLSYLKIGTYELKVQKTGFAPSARRLTTTVGAAYELTFSLAVGAAESSVTVEAHTAELEAARSQIAGTVSQTEVRNMPLNGRSFLDLALLIPGVSPTNTASNQLFAETSAVPGQGISVGSQRNFSNSFIVDGLSANDDAAGLSGSFFGLDTVQEFQVVTSGGQAELGRALGGYISAVTKSGTNTLHGDVYAFFRNQRFNAANPLNNAKLPLTQAQYGASLGGRIVPDRTFYFANFEQRQQNQSGLITISPANVAIINNRLNAINFPGARIAAGIYSNPVHMTTALGKIDHRFGTRDQLSIRYNAYDVTSRNSRGAGALNDASASAGLDNTDHTLAVSNIFTLSSRTVNETRGQFTHSNLLALPTDLKGPSVAVAGVASFGRLSGAPTGRINKIYEIVNNISHQARSHAIRAGFNLLYNDTTLTYPRTIRGSYAFSSLANFLTGTYNNAGYTQTFGATTVPQTSPNVGSYAQDEWKLCPSLTINLGVRHDIQTLKTINTDTNNVSPRAGFAWSPFQNRRTVVRGGFGLYYDRIPLRAVANALLSSGNTTTITSISQLSISLSPTQSGAPVFPNILSTAPPAGLVNFSTMDPNMQNAYSNQRSIEVEHRLSNTASFSAGYQYLRGLHLIISVNQNVPSCVAAGTNNGCRPHPDFANNSQYKSLADSGYNALHLSFQQRPSSWGSYRIAYSCSRSSNNVGEFFFSSPIDPFNIWRDYGRSDDDQRHRVVVNGTLQRYGFQLSGMLQYFSSLPLNITTGATTVHGAAARPLVDGNFVPRNAGTGADNFVVNLRLSRSFVITEALLMELLAEGFNSLNHRNDLTRNGVFGTGAYPANPNATFGQITAVNDPRSLQIALRFRF